VRSILKSAAWLCLTLTLWSVFAFAEHHHSNPIDAAKCTICIAAHTASPKPASTTLHGSFVAFGTLQPNPLSVKQRLIGFALSVRPPPAV